MHSIIYFSPTGNALYLAKRLANHLGSERTTLAPLEFTDPGILTANKHLILMFPVHGFNAPVIVKKFVKKLAPGLYDYVSLIAVGCASHWANGAVTSTLRKTLVTKNYQIIVDEVLAMPLTFIMAFPDDLSFKVINESEDRISIIGDSILNRSKSIHQVRVKSRLFSFIGRIEIPAARLFGLELHANRHCISCGLCWENCPARNISQGKKDKPRFGFSCMMCMRCIYNCPEKAISPRFSKFIPLRKGYSLNKFR